MEIKYKIMTTICIIIIVYLTLKLGKHRRTSGSYETTRDDDRFVRMFRYGAPVLEHQYARWALHYGPIFFSRSFDKGLTKIQNDCRRGWNEFLKRVSIYNSCHEGKFV